jgi:hypothetical protein
VHAEIAVVPVHQAFDELITILAWRFSIAWTLELKSIHRLVILFILP